MNHYLKNQLKFCLFTLLGLVFCTAQTEAGVVYDDAIQVEEYSVGFRVKWSTLKEVDCATFIVERSIDGEEYEEVGTVRAEGKAGRGSSYSYKDLELGLKKAYYRLRQVDVDGNFNLSKFVSKKKTTVHSYMVTHKEALKEGLFEVTVQSIKEGEMMFQISNLMGEVIQQEKQPLEFGLNTVLFNLEFETPGNYIATLKVDNELETIYLKREENKEQKKNVASKPEKGRG